MALIVVEDIGLVHTSQITRPWKNVLKRWFMKDVMVDLETLGTAPGCAILSIGAVGFNWRNGEVDEGMYVVINRENCKQAGLHEDDRTLSWWGKQSAEARDVLHRAGEGGVTLELGLSALDSYLRGLGTGIRVWGNGADFDNPILACAYKAVGMRQGWMPYNGRCYRTVKNLAPHIKMEREGVYHNALDDAKSQAKHIIKVIQHLNLEIA